MPIKAAPLVAQQHKLLDVDPSGDTWVYIQPAGRRARLQRADLVKEREYTDDGITTRINFVELQDLEIWLTCGNEDGEIANIEVELEDGTVQKFFEKNRKTYTQATFLKELDELYRLAPGAVANWHAGVKLYNPGWVYPF